MTPGPHCSAVFQVTFLTFHQFSTASSHGSLVLSLRGLADESVEVEVEVGEEGMGSRGGGDGELFLMPGWGGGQSW